MAKMILTSQGFKIDPRGVALDKKIEKKRELQKELDALPRWQVSRRSKLKKELKDLQYGIRVGVAITTGIDPG